MREDTTRSHDQPRTAAMSQVAGPGQAGAMPPMPPMPPPPAPAAPVDQPPGTTYGTPPPDPEPAPYDRPEPDLEAETARMPADADPAPAEPTFDEPQATDPVAETAAPGPGHQQEDTGAVLFGGDDVERFRDRWRDLQADFVDDPTQAVRGADQLIGEVMRALSDIFAQHKHELEEQWRADGTGETEQLRVALRRYRSFFDQLLKT